VTGILGEPVETKHPLSFLVLGKKKGILKFALFLELQEQTDNNGSQTCNKLSSLVHGAKYQHKHPNLQHSMSQHPNIQHSVNTNHFD